MRFKDLRVYLLIQFVSISISSMKAEQDCACKEYGKFNLLNRAMTKLESNGTKFLKQLNRPKGNSFCYLKAHQIMGASGEYKGPR